MKYFLIVYDQRSGTLISVEEFDEPDRELASRARLEFEANYRERPEIEVVVLGSASRATLMKTHGRYFKSVGELASEP